jgi:hypothetical protein
MNAKRHQTLLAVAHKVGVTHREVVGYYGGTREDSVLLVAATRTERELAAKLAALAVAWFDQESCLVVAPNDSATLVFSDGKRQALGQYTAISAELAERTTAYTLDRGIYYRAA